MMTVIKLFIMDHFRSDDEQLEELLETDFGFGETLDTSTIRTDFDTVIERAVTVQRFPTKIIRNAAVVLATLATGYWLGSSNVDNGSIEKVTNRPTPSMSPAVEPVGYGPSALQQLMPAQQPAGFFEIDGLTWAGLHAHFTQQIKKFEGYPYWGCEGIAPGWTAANACQVVDNKYRRHIDDAARYAGIHPDILRGMIILESGSLSDRRSSAGCVGIAQFYGPTAKAVGLRVDSEVDERLDDEKSIAAMGKLMRENLEAMGEPGLAIWAYHAGTGNVADVVYGYLPSKFHKNSTSATVLTAGLTYAELHQQVWPDKHPDTSQVLRSLNDESEDYVMKVAASVKALELYRADKDAFEATRLKHID